jgi:N utilization substance protein A
MPFKKRKTKSKQTKPKTTTSKRAKKASREKGTVAPKKTAKKKQSKKKVSSEASSARKREIPVRRAQRVESSWGREDTVSSRQSGDLEGLSRAEQADSESVNELVEEGNVFEAGAVAGVEEADDQDTREVHTHELPEDDVPDEYLDKD